VSLTGRNPFCTHALLLAHHIANLCHAHARRHPLASQGLLVEPGVAAFERLTVNRPNATKVPRTLLFSPFTGHNISDVLIQSSTRIMITWRHEKSCSCLEKLACSTKSSKCRVVSR